jgi:hypothetical protein
MIMFSGAGTLATTAAYARAKIRRLPRETNRHRAAIRHAGHVDVRAVGIVVIDQPKTRRPRVQRTEHRWLRLRS